MRALLPGFEKGGQKNGGVCDTDYKYDVQYIRTNPTNLKLVCGKFRLARPFDVILTLRFGKVPSTYVYVRTYVFPPPVWYFYLTTVRYRQLADERRCVHTSTVLRTLCNYSDK